MVIVNIKMIIIVTSTTRIINNNKDIAHSFITIFQKNIARLLQGVCDGGSKGRCNRKPSSPQTEPLEATMTSTCRKVACEKQIGEEREREGEQEGARESKRE